jgi:hypothetical protein
MNSSPLRNTTIRTAASQTSQRNAWSVAGEEAIISDSRASFTPAEAVENKLRYLLRSHPIGVSHLMTARLAAHRPR